MKVTVVEHPVPVPEPPKTYEVKFEGLMLDEFVLLRAAVSDGKAWRDKLKGCHFGALKRSFDAAYPEAYTLADKHLDRITGNE